MYRLAMGAHSTSNSVGGRDYFFGVKGLEHEADNLQPLMLKMSISIHPDLYALMACEVQLYLNILSVSKSI